MFDYGKGGQTVEGVVKQIKDEFIPQLGEKPEWAKWSSADTLFGE